MMKAMSVVALGAPVLGDICDEGTTIQVEPLVFSGTPNPQFEISDVEKREVFCRFLSENNGAKKVPTCRAVGFAGWQACANGECQEFRGEAFLDHFLLTALKENHPQLPEAVFRHITEEMERLGEDGDVECPEEAPVPVPNAQCDGTNHGSDDPSEIHYDDQNDADGCFVTMQSKNNCYNYGNDLATNTFAQPGRGSGVCAEDARPCVANTCEDVKNAAISDGLQWVGTDLPTTLPETGHYVSLHIWPDSNFHWLRMNADMKWSHKPGGSPVRDYDNNHDQITDPHQADVSPWSEHCGYMLATPSVSTIHYAASEAVVA
jgi:hypothetical protein